jgi:pyruvate formate lyase activating enzyme
VVSNVQCRLCPKECTVAPGQGGDCRVRVNLDGRLRSVVYGFPCAVNVDPVEKKPFFHFLPGTNMLSLATVGCNLHCLNCQNWEISQANPEDSTAAECPPDRVVALAQERRCPSIACTYTEPLVYYEYTLDIATRARKAGVRSVLVTAAYISPEPWQRLLEVIDAVTVDIKFMSDDLYRSICSGTLRPVLDAIIAAKAAGVWVEVSNLVIPTLNDRPEDVRQLAQWVKDSLGVETPLHFLGFYPRYKMQHLPPTSDHVLETARDVARGLGLRFVYVGNVTCPDGQNTRCPSCGRLLVERSGFSVLQNRLKEGRCPGCGKTLAGVWE